MVRSYYCLSSHLFYTKPFYIYVANWITSFFKKIIFGLLDKLSRMDFVNVLLMCITIFNHE